MKVMQASGIRRVWGCVHCSSSVWLFHVFLKCIFRTMKLVNMEKLHWQLYLNRRVWTQNPEEPYAKKKPKKPYKDWHRGFDPIFGLGFATVCMSASLRTVT